jgi:hypothetical protein
MSLNTLPINVQLKILYYLPSYHLAQFSNKKLWEICASKKFYRWDPSIDWFYKIVSPTNLRLKNELYIMTLSDIYWNLSNPLATELNTTVSLKELNNGFYWKCDNEEVSKQCKPFQIISMANKTGIMTCYDSFSELAMPDNIRQLLNETVHLINYSYTFAENEDGLFSCGSDVPFPLLFFVFEIPHYYSLCLKNQYEIIKNKLYVFDVFSKNKFIGKAVLSDKLHFMCDNYPGVLLSGLNKHVYEFGNIPVDEELRKKNILLFNDENCASDLFTIFKPRSLPWFMEEI